jgi:hypothetical protein
MRSLAAKRGGGERLQTECPPPGVSQACGQKQRIVSNICVLKQRAIHFRGLPLPAAARLSQMRKTDGDYNTPAPERQAHHAAFLPDPEAAAASADATPRSAKEWTRRGYHWVPNTGEDQSSSICNWCITIVAAHQTAVYFFGGGIDE